MKAHRQAAYYNEIDPYAAGWLRNLIAAGHLAAGDVDTRRIEDVQPDDLRGYTQCHFFAGIGGWSLALRRAGWPDDKPIWTGSCPCQPFSSAGKGEGFADERHLWPHFHWLIQQCQPSVVFGEQVASKDGLAWLDLVQADLEGTGYASGAVDLCAAGVGAPHIRQRLWWVAERLADAAIDRRIEGREVGAGHPERVAPQRPFGRIAERSGDGRLGDDDNARLEGQWSGYQAASGRQGEVRPVAEAGELGGVADANGERRRERKSGHENAADATRTGEVNGTAVQPNPSPTNGHWRDADWLFCRDGNWRPVEPGTFPLAHGIPNRVGRLRGYGNAIVPQVAAEVIAAYMECMP